MEIQKEECAIKYSKERKEIVVTGAMRLFGTEHYEEIANVLAKAVEDELPTLTLNLVELRFLNSSGINVFFKFLIALRKKGVTTLTIKGTNEHFWQKKTLLNFQKILSTAKLEI